MERNLKQIRKENVNVEHKLKHKRVTVRLLEHRAETLNTTISAGRDYLKDVYKRSGVME